MVEIFAYFIASQPQCVAGLEDELKEELSNSVPENRINEVFALLSSTTRVSKLSESP